MALTSVLDQETIGAPPEGKLWLDARKFTLPVVDPKLKPVKVNSCIKLADEGSTSSISTAVVIEGAGVCEGFGVGVALGAGVEEATGVLVGKGKGFSEGKGKGLKKEIAIGTAKRPVSIYYGQ